MTKSCKASDTRERHVEFVICEEIEELGVQVEFCFDVEDLVVDVLPLLEEPVPAPAPQHRKNKIINSSYKSGENLRGDDYHFDSSIQIDRGYAENNLASIYDVENNMAYKKVQEIIMELLDTNAELNEMLDDSEQQTKKFNKEKVNRMFKIICDYFESTMAKRQFMNMIYIFDNVSNMSGLKYASLYDLLDIEYKQRLLVELNETHNIFAQGNVRNNRLF